MSTATTFDVAIAGAGPAGSSAAIQLALSGARVLLVEEKKFPRAKLCGEFISPECLTHFRRLGVIQEMNAAGGAALYETVFYSRHGKSLSVPSEWFKPGAAALGLSRSEMDHQLLERAKNVGVTVLEEAHATLTSGRDEDVGGVHVKTGDVGYDYQALVTIDATGRTRALARQLDRPQLRHRKRPVVGFKAHLENVGLPEGACEIYFYRRGYGGLSAVEGGASNLCFMMAASDVRRCESDPERAMREIVMQNPRAAFTLAHSRALSPWLSVSLESFGRRTLVPRRGLLTIGDAAAFIDPFTGSGMLLALESGNIAADAIASRLPLLRQGKGFESLANTYRTEYSRRFGSRLRISGLLRRASFVPYLDDVAIFFLGHTAHLRRKVARATRHSSSGEARLSSG